MLVETMPCLAKSLQTPQQTSLRTTNASKQVTRCSIATKAQHDSGKYAITDDRPQSIANLHERVLAVKVTFEFAALFIFLLLYLKLRHTGWVFLVISPIRL